MKRLILSALLCAACFVAKSQLPTANFTAATVSGCSPLIVDFQDLSSGNPTKWSWDFGNGGTSSLQNPSATYFTPGIYTVKLTVTNANGTNTLVRTSFITIYSKPSINFSVNDSIGCYPFHVQFTDQSTTGPGTTNNSWFWDFGDGTQSNQQNPTHTYTESGNYTIALKVTNDKGCWSVFSKQNFIRINGGVTSDFINSQPTVCQPPYAISFTQQSTGTGSTSFTYFWDFGDGNTSTEANPVHLYQSPGNYTVKLATTSSLGCTDTMTKVNQLNFLDIQPATNAPDSICINEAIVLQNLTTPAPVSASWDFGDGTNSTQTNPQKSWASPGIYNIRLINTYSYCQDTLDHEIVVSPRPTAAFTSADTARCQPPLTVNFQNQSQGGVSYFWDFGDGNTSTETSPSHTYLSFGNFTVSLIVTNSFGCTDTVTKNDFIKIIRPQITIPMLPLEGCVPYGVNFTANIATLDEVTSYLWDFGDGNTSTSENPYHTYPNQGTYDVTLTITTSTGCTESTTLNSAIKVGRKPIIDFSAMPSTSCAFQDIQFTDLTNEADKWTWHFGDGETSTEQHPSHEYADTGRFDVMLIAVNNGCEDSLTKPEYITIKPPISKFGYIPDCTNRLRFSFRDSSIGATSLLWDFGDGNTSTLQHPDHIYTNFGTYTVTLTVTNDTCEHSYSRDINVFEENLNFNAADTVACKTAYINMSANNINFNNIVSYYWDFGNGTTATTSGPYVNSTFNTSGLFTVSLTTTDIYGCPTTKVKTNYIRIQGPEADFSADNVAGCIGLTTLFNDSSTGDGNSEIENWLWDFGDGSIESFNAPPFQHVYNIPGKFSVKLTVTDANGCKDSLIKTNIINATDPKANFVSADTLSCPGSPVNFQNTSSAINYTSSWSFGDGDQSTVKHPDHSYMDTGMHSVKLVITDQYGCSDSVTKEEYIRVSRPVASFTVSDSVSSCLPFQVDFTNTSHYYSSSLWDLGGGTSSQANPVNFYVIPGSYLTSLVVTSPGGCKDTAYQNIILHDTTGTRIEYTPLDGCSPLTVFLDAFTSGPMRFTWDLGDGNIVTSDSTNLTHVYTNFGDFVPKVIMTDPAGCIIPVTGYDTIRIIGAEAKFGLDNMLLCDSGWVNFIDSTTNNDFLTNYTWNFGDGNTSNLQQPSHYYTAPGIYTVSLAVETQNQCVDTFSLTNVVKVVESPLISIGGDSVICIYELITHTGVFERPDTSIVQWKWEFPNGNSSIVQLPEQQKYSATGNFIVSTIATNSSGCRDTATKNILVNPLPTVTMPPSITKQAGFPVTIPAMYTSNVIDYTWAPSSTLSCENCAQPLADPKFNTIYNVAFVDSNGCRNTGQIEVIVFCVNANVFIPNTFSPNNDGSNDVFYVRGKGLERVKTLRIFNRWGEVVFEKNNFPVNDASFGWNGTFKGNKAQPDVYVYQVEVFCENSDIIRYEGNVALIQ